jgi:hypothetical protein
MGITSSDEEILPDLDRRRFELNKRKRAWRAKNGLARPIRSDSTTYTYSPPREDPIGDLCRIVAVLIVETRKTNNNTPSNEKGKTKGKNINARMLATFANDKLSVDWSSTMWAQHLDCAESTVRGTKTWNEVLKVSRQLTKLEEAEKMDQSRLSKRNRLTHKPDEADD